LKIISFFSFFYKDEVFDEEQSEGEDEYETEDEVDMEVAALFATLPAAALHQEETATGRSRRPTLRHSRQTDSEGGSPLAKGLPYTGRPICKYT